MDRAVGRLGWIQVDTADPMKLAEFWGAVLGRPILDPLEDPPQYVGLQPIDAGMIVSFQRVPEAKVVKNRLHFDIQADDVAQAQASIEALGGARLPMEDFLEDGYAWRQMADPDGNEFCLIFETPDV